MTRVYISVMGSFIDCVVFDKELRENVLPSYSDGHLSYRQMAVGIGQEHIPWSVDVPAPAVVARWCNYSHSSAFPHSQAVSSVMGNLQCFKLPPLTTVP